jgi:hypothetical protein
MLQQVYRVGGMNEGFFFFFFFWGGVKRYKLEGKEGTTDNTRSIKPTAARTDQMWEVTDMVK